MLGKRFLTAALTFFCSAGVPFWATRARALRACALSGIGYLRFPGSANDFLLSFFRSLAVSSLLISPCCPDQLGSKRGLPWTLSGGPSGAGSTIRAIVVIEAYARVCPWGDPPVVTPLSRESQPRTSLRIPARAASVAAARSWARTRLAHLPSPQLRDDVVLLVSELVTNGVRHAGTDVVVELALLESGVYLAVSDESPLPLRPRYPALHDEGGRGLALVEALSTRWGVIQSESGQQVWAELQPNPG